MSSHIDLQAIDRGLGALASLLQVPEVRTTVAVFHADFMAAAQQIEIMGDYKEVHDKLHQLQFLCYNSIVTQSARFPADDLAVDIITDHELTLRSIVAKLQEVAARPTLSPDELSWIQDLVQARSYLAQALETRDTAFLRRCCLCVRRVLDRYPSLINTRLNAAARALRMGAIVQAMVTIKNTLDHLEVDPQKAQAFVESTAYLADLNNRLTVLVSDHDRWQDVDVQFRRIEAGIDSGLDELEESWTDLQSKIKPLVHDEGQEWVLNLQRSAAALDHAIAGHDPVRTRSCFGRYRRAAGERFFQVDTELKDLCGQLRTIGTPLAAVAELIAAATPQPPRPMAYGLSASNHLAGQLAEYRKHYDELTARIAAIDKDIGQTLDSEQMLILKQRRDEREAERNDMMTKIDEIEARLATWADRH